MLNNELTRKFDAKSGSEFDCIVIKAHLQHNIMQNNIMQNNIMNIMVKLC